MTFQTSREIAAPLSSVFAAFEDKARLAAWWGPAGFTSTFKTYEFSPGGKWSFTMHGPDGKIYPNEIVITEIEPSRRIVIHHTSQPRYLLTVTLEPTANGGTVVRWNQDFENPDVGHRMEQIVVPANEQLLDRLSAEVLRKGAEPILLAGGNPQIAKADGDAPVQAYIEAIPGWKRDVVYRLDALIVRTIPNVNKAVKWNSPFYGIEGQGWFLSLHCFTKYVKVAFFRGTSLHPLPSGESKQAEVRYLNIYEGDSLDEAQLTDWIKQASQLPGWGKN